MNFPAGISTNSISVEKLVKVLEISGFLRVLGISCSINFARTCEDPIFSFFR